MAMQQVNIYRNHGEWAYALWIDGEFDCSYPLEADTEEEARAEVAAQFPAAEVRRVADAEL